MFQITKAWVQRGWSALDHLIDDEPAHRLIGRTYSSMTSLMAAVTRAEARAWPIAVRFSGPGGEQEYCMSGQGGVPRRVIRAV